MPRIAINALTNTPFEVKDNGTVREVHAKEGAQSWIAPGFIDLQVNGFGGFDYNRPDLLHAEIATSVRSLYATGVTRFFPTIITGSPGDMLQSLHNLTVARRSLSEGAAIAGFHVEGPYIARGRSCRGTSAPLGSTT
jgi:N-acetylglucosamine-6-phosphate deacetylase